MDEDSLGEHNLLPLSGGLDSRFLAAALKSKGSNLRTFTFGSFGSAEVPLARQVANLLHIPWQEIELRPDDYLSCGKDLVLLTGGLLSAMHMHLLSCVRRMKLLPEETLVHGFMGDPIAGDHAHDPADRTSREEVVARTLALRGVSEGPFSDLVPRDIVATIDADLRACAADNESVNPPSFLGEFMFIVERQCMIRYLPAVLETVAPVACPFESAAYAELFLDLPFPLRQHRRLFRQAASALHGALFDLPSTASGTGSPRSDLFSLLHRKFRGIAQLSSDFLTNGHLVWFSPFNYEQHFFLLNRIHRQRIEAAARLVAGRTRGPFEELVRRALHWRVRRPDLAFGVLSLGYLLSRLDDSGFSNA